MAPRPTWKGYLRVSLVTIPVKVFPATESAATLSFNQLHAECQTRIQQKRWCSHCEREVPNSELVKGYEFEKGRYVVVSDEDLQKVRVESTRVIDLVQFTDDTSIDPIYVDRAYYLAPDGAMGAEAFAVMRDGMAGKAGIGKVALYGREYLVAVRPQRKGLVMYTLHHDAEIRGIDQIEELNSVPSKVKPEEMKLAKQVIATFDGELNLKDYQRRVHRRAAQDHRREGRRRGNRRDRDPGAAEGRGSDGGAAPQSGCRRRRQEAHAEGRTAEAGGKAEGRRREEAQGRIERLWRPSELAALRRDGGRARLQRPAGRTAHGLASAMAC